MTHLQMYDREMWGQVKDVRLIEDVLELFLEYLSNSLIWTAELILTYCWASRESLEIWQTIFLCQELTKAGAKSCVSELGVLQFKKDCQNALSSMCKKALDKCPLKYAIIHNMTCLDPGKKCTNPDECLQKMKCLIQKFVQDKQLSGGISAGKW